MELIPTDYTHDYRTFKQELDTELNKAADGFVKIGYLLKVARDTDVLREGEYKTVAEFAAIEYGISKDIVSRYIAINDRFSEGGYAPCLAERYHGFGMAKLAEMLTLPDNIIEAIPDNVTKEEIREIKKEYAEEQKTTDIELLIEAAEIEKNTESAGYDTENVWSDNENVRSDNENAKNDTENSNIVPDINDTEPDNIMKLIIFELFKNSPEEMMQFNKSFKDDIDVSGKDVFEIMAPSGSRVITSRIPGKGRYMLSITGVDAPVKVTSMRDASDTVQYTMEELAEYIKAFVAPDGDCKLWYQLIFNCDWPVKEEPKPVETKPSVDKRPDKKPEKKKQSKVTVVKPKEELREVEEEKQEVEAPAEADTHELTEDARNEDNETGDIQHNEEIIETGTPENGLNTRADEENIPDNDNSAENEEVAPVQQPENGLMTRTDITIDEFTHEWKYAVEVIKLQSPALTRYLNSYDMPAAINIKKTIDDMWDRLEQLYRIKPEGIEVE